MEETGIMAFPFVARFLVRLQPPDGWEADGQSNMGHTHNTYRLFAPFARGFIVRKTSREWDDYVRAMQSGR